MLVPAAGAPATTHVYVYRCVGAMNSLTAVDLNGTGGGDSACRLVVLWELLVGVSFGGAMEGVCGTAVAVCMRTRAVCEACLATS